MKEKEHSVIRSTAVVGGYTWFSRLLGFLREVLMAYFFGTGLLQSAFTVAFAVPNLFRRLFGEGALCASFVPVFTESLEKEGRGRAWLLARRVLTLAVLVLAVIVAVGVAGISVAMELFGDSLTEKTMIVLSLTRIMLPYMLFICMVALFMAILNSFRHFAVPAATAAVLNTLWIVTLLIACPPNFKTDPEKCIHIVAWCILGAGLVQVLFQLPPLFRFGFIPKPLFSWGKDKRVAEVLKLMAPAAAGMGVFQLNAMVDRLLAFMVSDWGAAALRFSERLVYLPLGIFGTAMATVLLPTLSLQATRKSNHEMRETLNSSLRHLMLVTIPASLGLVVLAHPIVRFAFQWGALGEFDDDSTTQTARALMFYAPGLVVFSLYKVFVPAFYAMKDTKTPIRIGFIAIGLNFVLNIVFVITWPYDFKHAGLALATVLSSALNGTILGFLLHKRIGSLGWKRIARSVAAMLAAAAVMGVVVFFADYELGRLAVSWIPVRKIAHLVSVPATILVGVIAYTCIVHLLCPGELKELVEAARSRKKEKDEPPQPYNQPPEGD